MHTRLTLSLLLLTSCVNAPKERVNTFGFRDQELDAGALPARISFGSCADQQRPQPILAQVTARAPDLFVYLGDNIYGDTEDMQVLRDKYSQLAAKPEFQAPRHRLSSPPRSCCSATLAPTPRRRTSDL